MKNIATAIVAFQSELKPVDKSASNPYFKSKYAPLNEVMESIQPLLAKHELAVMQFMSEINGQPALTTKIVHISGEVIEATTPLLLAKIDPQGHGSAVTYARRYGVMSALGIVADEDDDANKAVERAVQATKQIVEDYNYGGYEEYNQPYESATGDVTISKVVSKANKTNVKGEPFISNKVILSTGESVWVISNEPDGDITNKVVTKNGNYWNLVR